MKKHRFPSIGRTLLSVALLVAVAAFALPQTTLAANTSAQTKIINVVDVTYADSSNTETYSASDFAVVTVELVASAPEVYGLLTTDGDPTDTSAICPAGSAGTFDMGETGSVLYAINATANGDDIYDLAMNKTNNTVTSTVVYNLLAYDGSVIGVNNPGTATLGSAVPVGVKLANPDTLLFPGGTLSAIVANDVVVLEYADNSKHVFLVNAVVAGTAPTDDPTQEVQAELKLEPYTTQTINNIDFSGPATADFATNGYAPGSVVAELQYVLVSITGTNAAAGVDGSVDFDLDVKSQTAPAAVNDVACTVSFTGVDLSITKEVRSYDVVTSGWRAAFAATANGNPGDYLEYQVTISNAGGDATFVTVTDAVPAYTSVVSHTTYGDRVAGTIFATIADGNDTVPLTLADDSEVQDTDLDADTDNTGFGKVVGTDMTFYVGKTSNNTTGGAVDSVTTYTITYQVQID